MYLEGGNDQQLYQILQLFCVKFSHFQIGPVVLKKVEIVKSLSEAECNNDKKSHLSL